MDQEVIKSAEELFLGSMKSSKSPSGTEFIDAAFKGKAYLLSFSPLNNHYVFTVNYKVIYAGFQKESILNALEKISQS
jgi:hypothetical protein